MAPWAWSTDDPDNLLEVFSIAIFSEHIDDVRNAEIYGKVVAHDFAEFGIVLYDKSEETASGDSVLPDGTLRLTGPVRCLVSPHGQVELCLWEKHHKLEIARGGFELTDDSFFQTVPFNKRVCSVIPGKDGYAVLNFMVYDRAVEAIVNVSLLNDDPISCYGSIRACNDLCEYNCGYDIKYFQVSMFNASKEKPKEPKANMIPLSRSKVAVPLKSRLIIKAQLFEATTGTEIVDDSAYFPVATCGSESIRIGNVMIKVDWLVDPFGTPGTVRPVHGLQSPTRVKRLAEAMDL